LTEKYLPDAPVIPGVDRQRADGSMGHLLEKLPELDFWPGTERPVRAGTRKELVIRRLHFDVIDDEDGHGALLRLQFQPELLAERVKE
jgi:hypothetical protein